MYAELYPAVVSLCLTEVSWLTCYFRHLREVFEKAGIEVTKENKQDLDRVIHGIVGVEYKDCSATWVEVKKRLAENTEAFIAQLGRAWNRRAR